MQKVRFKKEKKTVKPSSLTENGDKLQVALSLPTYFKWREKEITQVIIIRAKPGK